MCNDRSWKSCSIVTIVFTTMLMLGMFISVGVMNSMFGDNMQCYVDAIHGATGSRRQMFEGMDKIAAQHPSGDDIAAGKLALFNTAQTFGLGPAVKHFPAFRSLAPEGRKLAEAYQVGQRVQGNWMGYGLWRDGRVTAVNSDNTYDISYDDGSDEEDVPATHLRTASPPSPPYNSWQYNSALPNDDSCESWNLNDQCDDITRGSCACGTDYSDCGYRSSSEDCYRSSSEEKTAEESVAEVEKVRCPPPTSLRAPPSTRRDEP